MLAATQGTLGSSKNIRASQAAPVKRGDRQPEQQTLVVPQRQCLRLVVYLPVQWSLPPARGTMACPYIVTHITKSDTWFRCGRIPSYSIQRSAWKGDSPKFAGTAFSEVRVGAQLSPPASHDVPSCVSFPFLAALLQGTGRHEGSNPNPSTILCTLLPSVSIV